MAQEILCQLSSEIRRQRARRSIRAKLGILYQADHHTHRGKAQAERH